VSGAAEVPKLAFAGLSGTGDGFGELFFGTRNSIVGKQLSLQAANGRWFVSKLVYPLHI